MWCRRSLVVGLLLVSIGRPARAEPADPLNPLLSQAESFIHRGETDGVTLDPRHFPSLPEHLRLTVVPQLLAFCDLQRAAPSDSRLLDVVERADFLVRMGARARSGDAADGMLAYALLRAFEVTGNPAYRDAAQPVIDGFLAAPVTGDANRALMAGLALALDARLTSDPMAQARVSEISLLAQQQQHADGSFDHVCEGARDVHYTAWIAMEMDLVLRLAPDAGLGRALDRAQQFLSGRIAPDGTIAYQDAPAGSATVLYYYSAPACPSDYDTRGWTNELGYHALLFDRLRDARYTAIMARLASLQSQGAWPDKWGYLPSWKDPSYVWSTAPRSVVRTSLVFWSLAEVQARRAGRGQDFTPTAAPRASLVRGEEFETSALRLAPNPARSGAWITLRLAQPSPVRLQVLDASGRRLRELLDESLAAGSWRIRWDGRDQAGAPAPSGVYFVRVEAEGRARTTRLIWLSSGR